MLTGSETTVHTATSISVCPPAVFGSWVESSGKPTLKALEAWSAASLQQRGDISASWMK